MSIEVGGGGEVRKDWEVGDVLARWNFLPFSKGLDTWYNK